VYSHGSYTTINVPGAVNTDVVSINNAGDIDGTYQDSANGPHYGFLYSHGTYTTIAPPGSQNTHVSGTINSSGEIVGSFTTTSGSVSGFIYDHGTYTILNFPGAVELTGPLNINDKGQVVGSYLTCSDHQITGQNSFIYSDGKFTTIPPETGGPTANDINNKGQIVGTYTRADGNTRGFLTQDKGQALVGAHDSFVFAPNLGEQRNANSSVQNAHPHKSEFADLPHHWLRTTKIKPIYSPMMQPGSWIMPPR
jgi:probable HAF family extracellular repeat protein